MIIPSNRKNEICSLAEFIANDFSDGSITLLDSIAKDEEVFYYFDHYENAFDGMLLYDNSDFHIHLNIDSGNRENSKRGRFTFAHELGHFFIDQHRLGLKYGLLEPHASFHNVNQKTIIELEADYFACCLLMPKENFRNLSGGRKFSLDTILNLSNRFCTSVLATTIRFAEIGTHEIIAVISENNIAKWFTRSNDFPNWPFKFKVGDKLPKTTVAGEYFSFEDKKYTSVETLNAFDWFYPFSNDHRADRKMYEQCYYSDSYGYVISLIWFD
jgi:Zn-dependent peptidase ImmA (M78 family)